MSVFSGCICQPDTFAGNSPRSHTSCSRRHFSLSAREDLTGLPQPIFHAQICQFSTSNIAHALSFIFKISPYCPLFSSHLSEQSKTLPGKLVNHLCQHGSEPGSSAYFMLLLPFVPVQSPCVTAYSRQGRCAEVLLHLDEFAGTAHKTT